MTTNVPRASASVAALLMLAGFALCYWSLTGLGVLTTATTPASGSGSGTGTGSNGGGFSGGSSGGGGGGAGGGF